MPGWITARLIAGVMLAALVLLVLHQCQAARIAGKQARLADAGAQAAQASGADAVGQVGAVAARQATADLITQENADAIFRAPGADMRVDPRVRDAALDGLCRRAAYRCTPDCLQRAVAAGMANPGAGCAAAH